MKLLRYGESGSERLGILDDEGVIREMSGLVDNITGEVLLDENLQKLATQDIKKLPVVSSDVRLAIHKHCIASLYQITGHLMFLFGNEKSH